MKRITVEYIAEKANIRQFDGPRSGDWVAYISDFWIARNIPKENSVPYYIDKPRNWVLL